MIQLFCPACENVVWVEATEVEPEEARVSRRPRAALPGRGRLLAGAPAAVLLEGGRRDKG